MKFPSERVRLVPVGDARLDREVLPDGTVLVSTNDTDPHFAEARAAEMAELTSLVNQYRAAGVPRPVVVAMLGASPATAREWARIEPDLTYHGAAVNRPTLHRAAYVLATNDARRVLEKLVGRDARGYFRTPHWPVSYWTAQLDDRGLVAVMESRFPKDIPREGGR